MLYLLIIAQESREIVWLRSELSRTGFACSIISPDNGLMKQIANNAPDLLLVEADAGPDHSRIPQLITKVKQKRSLPVITLIARETLDGIDGHLNGDDFLISPYDVKELVLRIKRLWHINGNISVHELVKCGSLTIDVDKCEVRVDGKAVELTFKEYELLKFLASNRDHVFTREVLLNKVWGYDYFGGDRTVDVHIRRLRSKIEDSKHAFIDTVRNIGYMFKNDR